MKTISNLTRVLGVGFLLLLGFAFGDLVAAQTCVQPPAGLASWWPGNGNANDMVGGNDGTLVGGVAFASAEVGQGFSFNGNGYVSFGTGPAITGTGPLTVDAWIRTTDEQGIIIQQRDAGGFNGEYVLSVGGIETAAGFAFDPGKVCWSTYGDWMFGFNFCSESPINDGLFHLIVATREADGSGRIYIDGVLDSSQNAPARTCVTCCSLGEVAFWQVFLTKWKSSTARYR
jgi:Concanavalin A-like lectin/glucanases superfamily